MAKNKRSRENSPLFPYPCEDSNDCLDFLESGEIMSFAEFCETKCGSGCPHCVYLDVPYSEEMKQNG